ncbi:MAG: hypothetical protein SV186_02905 [Candidatus Nanohaloarchaea archaeon]|nr:hypothetical protein [Candidatus Nanohaloarchaea archaeon]
MEFRTVLRSAFQLLRDRPLLFLPKLLMTAVWSLFWIQLIQGVTQPIAMQPAQARRLLGYMLLLVPVQILVYNAYFIIVRQYNTDTVDIWSAFRQGLGKLPQGLGAFFIPFIVGSLVAVPGSSLFILGQLNGNLLYQAAGLVLASAGLLVVTILFYFTPVSVVLGDSGFIEEFKRGYRQSRHHLRPVTGIALLSFVLLAVTTLLEGGLQRIGFIGFVLGRLVSSVINLYVLLVNPSMLLELEEN